VGRNDMVKLDTGYSRILSKEDLVSSDIQAYKELLNKAEHLLPAH